MSHGTYCVACGKYKDADEYYCICDDPIYTDTAPTKEQITELRTRYFAATGNRLDGDHHD